MLTRYVRSPLLPSQRQPASPICLSSLPPLSPLYLSIPTDFFDQLQKLMTPDETDRLQVLQAAGGDCDELRVSPCQVRLFFRASISLAHLAGAGRVDHAVLTS